VFPVYLMVGYVPGLTVQWAGVNVATGDADLLSVAVPPLAAFVAVKQRSAQESTSPLTQ
jgi:hypothetical protein